MKLLDKLTIINLKQNKKRSIATIIGILLSVSLVCAVSSMAFSLRASLMESQIDETGHYHYRLQDLTVSDKEAVSSNVDFDKTFVANLGYSLSDSKNIYKPYFNVLAMSNTDDLKSFNIELIEGRYPTNENEILITEHYMTNGLASVNVGDTLTLEVGDRLLDDGTILNENNPVIFEDGKEYTYDSDNEELIREEILSNKATYTVTVVGIAKRPNFFFEPSVNPGYTAIIVDEDIYNSADRYNSYLKIKNMFTYNEDLSNLLDVEDASDSNKNKNPLYNYESNTFLLRYEVFDFSDQTVSTILNLTIIVIIIILAVSVYCIKNSFDISASEKVKMYSIIKSTGATKRQIKSLIYKEGFYLGLIGIPLGVLGGFLASYILVNLINYIGQDMLTTNNFLIFDLSYIPAIISIIIAVITILLSCSKTARRVAKQSPIENIRNSSDLKLKSKKLRTPKYINKIFGMGGVLAHKNLKRSKKKYRTTVISLIMSIFVFIAMNSFIGYMEETLKLSFGEAGYNVYVYYNDDQDTEYSEKVLDTLITTFKSDSKFEEYSVHYTPDSMSFMLNNAKEYLSDRFIEEKKKIFEEIDLTTINIDFVILDKYSFDEYKKSLNITDSEVKTILLNEGYYATETKYVDMTYTNLKEADVINVTIKENNSNMDIVHDFTIDYITKEAPMGSYDAQNPTLVVCLDNFIQIVNKEQLDYIPKVYASFEDTDSILTTFNADTLLTDNFTFYDLQEVFDANRQIILIFSIFLYGFITVISLIGITNIFNTITSNIALRKKEFAMLKSIGMTNKEFNNMVNLETLFYSIQSLIIGIVLGTLSSVLIREALSSQYDLAFIMPYTAIIAAIVFVLILVYTIMKYSINKINKENIIEVIRDENT